MAHDLETKIVIYPRIILDNSIGNLDFKNMKLKKDVDNFWYVDYLSNISESHFEQIENIISTWTTRDDNNNRAILQKRNWFKNYYQQSKGRINKYGN